MWSSSDVYKRQKLHSEIIKESVFHDYYLFKPNAFKNVTNGIAYRRWLLASNPGLCKLLDETIGDGYNCLLYTSKGGVGADHIQNLRRLLAGFQRKVGHTVVHRPVSYTHLCKPSVSFMSASVFWSLVLSALSVKV